MLRCLAHKPRDPATLFVTLDTARGYVSTGLVSLYLARLFDLDVWTVVSREGPHRIVPTGNEAVDTW